MNDTPLRTGSCLCGAVRYEIRGTLRDVVACHCMQCRKASGHHVAATKAKHEDFKLTADETLKWFRSSDFAQRGFCGECGSNLFWQRDDAPAISIMAGTLDGPTGLKTACHIYCDDAGDYYEITDDLPKAGQEWEPTGKQ